MFAYIGGKKRPKKTLEGAVNAISEGYEGEKAIFDTETGKIYSLSGEETVILTPSEYNLMVEIFGICILAEQNPKFPFPSKTVSAMIQKMSPSVASTSVKSAAVILKKLWSKHNGQSEPGKSE
jgi:hypothetical protein